MKRGWNFRSNGIFDRNSWIRKALWRRRAPDPALVFRHSHLIFKLGILFFSRFLSIYIALRAQTHGTLLILVADSESGIHVFISRQNFPVLPNSLFLRQVFFEILNLFNLLVFHRKMKKMYVIRKKNSRIGQTVPVILYFKVKKSSQFCDFFQFILLSSQI